jgi:hypothetical protein
MEPGCSIAVAGGAVVQRAIADCGAVAPGRVVRKRIRSVGRVVGRLIRLGAVNPVAVLSWLVLSRYCSAAYPVAVSELPVVLLINASDPVAVFVAPVVLAASALNPAAVLS